MGLYVKGITKEGLIDAIERAGYKIPEIWELDDKLVQSTYEGLYEYVSNLRRDINNMVLEDLLNNDLEGDEYKIHYE